jgi:Caspase domain
MLAGLLQVNRQYAFADWRWRFPRAGQVARAGNTHEDLVVVQGRFGGKPGGMVVTATAEPAHAEKRVALVIGNNDYKHVPKLQKAVNDARTMGDTLKQLGFSVMIGLRRHASRSLCSMPAATIRSNDQAPSPSPAAAALRQ